MDRCGRALACLFLSLSCFASNGHAANPITLLELAPADTLIVILDQEQKLTGEGNQRLFRAAGFKVAVVNECAGADEIECLQSQVRDLTGRIAHKHILLMTTARHTRAVASIYAEERLRRLFAGVVLFRVEPGFRATAAARIGDALPLLVFGKIEDDKAALLAARRFADHMRSLGVPTWLYLLSDQTPAARAIKVIHHFIGAGRDGDVLADFLAAHARWQQKPLFDNEGFYRHAAFIEEHTADAGFLDTMRDFYFLDRLQLKKWELKRFTVFDVLAYRDSDAATRGARYLVLRNRLGQLCAIDLQTYGKYEPVIVIGIDEVKNLFRFNYFYRTKAGYSWIEGEPPRLSIRPLGAFVHFRKPVPEALELRLAIRSKLSFAGVQFASENPLARLDSLPPRLKKTMTYRNDCIYCHELDGAGGRAHHLAATSGEPQPGLALPLRDYPSDVLNSFFFDQERVAAKIGAIANPVPAEEAKELFEFLTAGR